MNCKFRDAKILVLARGGTNDFEKGWIKWQTYIFPKQLDSWLNRSQKLRVRISSSLLFRKYIINSRDRRKYKDAWWKQWKYRSTRKTGVICVEERDLIIRKTSWLELSRKIATGGQLRASQIMIDDTMLLLLLFPY